MDRVDKIRPEDGDNDLATAASIACTIVFLTLIFIAFKDTERLEEIAAIPIEMLVSYIEKVENPDYMEPDFQNKIDQHPLMLREENIQRGILAYLLKTEKLDYDDISVLLSLQESDKRSIS